MEDDSPDPGRTAAFLADSGADMLTGPRRMGRRRFVEHVVSVAEREGYSFCVYPGDASGRRFVFFDDWNGNSAEMERVSAENPGTEVLFGQDLCHQVPAIVRFRPSDEKYFNRTRCMTHR